MVVGAKCALLRAPTVGCEKAKGQNVNVCPGGQTQVVALGSKRLNHTDRDGRWSTLMGRANVEAATRTEIKYQSSLAVFSLWVISEDFFHAD